MYRSVKTIMSAIALAVPLAATASDVEQAPKPDSPPTAQELRAQVREWQQSFHPARESSAKRPKIKLVPVAGPGGKMSGEHRFDLPDGCYYFSAKSVAACQRMLPTIERLRRQGFRIVNVEVGAAANFSHHYAIKTVPTILIKHGADVVKLESIQRPDGFRYSGAQPFEGDDWYERSPLWQATNLNKRDITLDLSSSAGRDLARRLAAQADVVVENFSPRVVEQFGLDYESLVALRPDVIAVRMPGFGLDGPWRDYVGWALNIEQVSGMSAVTGYADGPPCNVQGPADPIVGVHAGVALLAALEHRRRTGEGQLIEVAQIEVGAAVTAEPVIEYSMNGIVRPREGNRQRGYCQGVYPTDTEDAWVALSVRDDNDWSQLVDAMGRLGLLEDDRLATADRRAAAHDVFDQVVAAWSQTRSPANIVAALRERGIPVEEVIAAEQMYDVPQLDTRGYYEDFEHAITGWHRYPGWPFRISPGPARHHRCAPPTLGQHNNEILSGLGLSRDELAALRRDRVIGERVMS